MAAAWASAHREERDEFLLAKVALLVDEGDLARENGALDAARHAGPAAQRTRVALVGELVAVLIVLFG